MTKICRHRHSWNPLWVGKRRQWENHNNLLCLLHSLKSFQEFLIRLDMKPPMHLVKISIFSLNNVTVRTDQNHEPSQHKLGLNTKSKFSKTFFIKRWSPKGCLSLLYYSLDMSPTLASIFCQKNMFFGRNFCKEFLRINYLVEIKKVFMFLSRFWGNARRRRTRN